MIIVAFMTPRVDRVVCLCRVRNSFRLMVDIIHRELSDEDIKQIADTVERFQKDKPEDEKGFCAVVTIQGIFTYFS